MNKGGIPSFGSDTDVEQSPRLVGIVLVLVFVRTEGLAPLRPDPKLLLFCNSRFSTLVARMKYLFKGRLAHANVSGIPMVFLNDFQAHEDLINARRDKYADRPSMVRRPEREGEDILQVNKFGSRNNLLTNPFHLQDLRQSRI